VFRLLVRLLFSSLEHSLAPLAMGIAKAVILGLFGQLPHPISFVSLSVQSYSCNGRN